MFVVYFLFSEKYEKDYVGVTGDLIDRFHSHNELSTKGYTINFRPWKVVHVEFFETKSEALKVEKYYKSGRGLYKKKQIINDGK